MKHRNLIFILLAGLSLLAACGGQPQPVEVTRLVTQELPVTIEVTRIVEQQTIVEMPVEVTRLVELVVTATPEPAATAVPTLEPTAAPSPTPLPDGSTYTVQLGDTLSSISDNTGTAVADIMAANNLTNDSFIAAGQELLIPGWDGIAQTTGSAPEAAPAPGESETPPEAVVQGPNLLPNPSFEGNWYFYLYNELQIPDGWQLVTDEGANNLEPGSGGLFNRPEVRVVPAKDLPPAEQSTFVFEGNKTVKAFKGGAPTSFSLFTDVTLQPGTYRLQIRFFPDTVAEYNGGQKTFASNPQSAEVRIIQDNGGTGWQNTLIGQRNTLTYDFTISDAATVRLGASFRNRFIMANNGWFIDDWSLYALAPQ